MIKARDLLRLPVPLLRAIGDAIAPREVGKGRLCVVNYHRILPVPDPLLDSEPTVDTFRWQMELLAKCFNVLPLHDAIQMLANERMPARAVAITFDDGYRSTHDLALPILREYNLPATVFVTTGHMESGSMWNDIILEATRRLPDGELALHDIGHGSYPLHTMSDRQHTALALTERSKYLPPSERTRLHRKLEMLVGGPLDQQLMLTREMVHSLDRHGIEIGGHTISHPILARIEDAKAVAEIVGNKQELESIIGRPLRLFAYPNGKRDVDFNTSHTTMVRDAGYVAAFTTAIGAVTSSSNRFEMPRSRPWDGNPAMFAARLLWWLSGKI